MGLKEDFMELQYEVLKKWQDDKEVYLVREKSTNLLLIKKVVSIAQKGIYEQLMHDSPHGCPKIRTVFSQEDKCIIYEEFIQGDTLQDILERNGKFLEKEVISYMTMLCDAVFFLHNVGIIHRDIQPKNVMLTMDGSVKLIDFGIARVYEPSKNKDTVLMGTVGYAAPEQYGINQTDNRTDIYALGVLMQVMLTGEPVDTSKATLKGKWKKIIQKCTQINPEKRYQTVQELKEDIQRQGSSYHFQGILRGIPGFRPKEKKYRRAIFLFGYPLTILWAAKISQEIFRNIKLPMPQFALWYVGAMFFSTGIPVILLADLFQIRTKLFQRKKYSKGTKVAISIAIGYVSVMVLGVMLALYYNL